MNERLRAITDDALRTTLLFARSAPHPIAADEAAAALRIHRNAARARLDRLAEAGLLIVSFERRTRRSGPGAGRPAKLYRVAPESEPLELPARRFPALMARLLDELPRRGRARTLRRVGEDFGRELAAEARLNRAATFAAGIENACGALRGLGFHAVPARIEPGSAVIETPTCPLRPLVVERPEAAEIDRGMWAGLLEAGAHGLHAEQVYCETHSCLDGDAPCSVVIRFGKPARGTGSRLRL